MAGSNPLTQSFLTSAGSRFNDCATTPLYTVKAISQTQNRTPLACNSLMPIGTTPTPGILKSPCLGFQKGLRVDGFLVLGSSALNVSPKLYFDHKRSSIAYGMAVWRNTTTILQSFSAVPVAAFVARNILGQAKGKISLGSGTSNTIRCLPFICLNH